MSERVKMLCEHLKTSQEGKIAHLARAFGVSRKTVYKWVKRYEAGSWDGLKDRSRAPRSHPNAVSAQTVARVVALRQRYPFWGAPKLRQKLFNAHGAKETPAESTVSLILKRQGLTRVLNRRTHATPTSGPLSHAQKPNEVWTIDFKGHFAMGNLERCYPLTICDAFSRYFLCLRGYAGCPDTEPVRQEMVATFREYGLPAAIRSDNGTPFATSGLAGLSQLSVWWVRLGIRLERIELAHPEQNGRHERVHRTLKEQTIPQAELAGQQKGFDEFRREYNLDRPHEALGQQPPALYYQASPAFIRSGSLSPSATPKNGCAGASTKTASSNGTAKSCGSTPRWLTRKWGWSRSEKAFGKSTLNTWNWARWMSAPIEFARSRA